MVDRIAAWQCIGCGRLEAPQNCIGVCQDRKVELIDARSYDELQQRRESERAAAARVLELVQQLAWSTPRPDAWERSYLALQKRARVLLEGLRCEADRNETASAPIVRLDA
jgi:hypothetical protein